MDAYGRNPKSGEELSRPLSLAAKQRAVAKILRARKERERKRERERERKEREREREKRERERERERNDYGRKEKRFPALPTGGNQAKKSYLVT